MNYNLEMLEFNRIRERVKYPDYQREYVWNKQMQRSLVLSVLDDLPIGTITVYKDENSNFIVIDGLQRINTMLNYCEKISSLYYYKDVEKKLQIKKILTEKLNSENEAKELNKCLKKWYKDEANLERRVNGKVVRNISSDFLKATKVKYDRVMIEDLVEEITNAIISIADINNYRIPLLVCDDAQEQLPIVFERMNTVQKKLTKYEVYAATWYDIKFRDSMNIINKFEKMQIEENGPRKKNTPEKDYIRLHQIFLFYSWEMDRRLKKQKNDPFKFNNQSLFEIYSLLKTRKVYKINSYIMGKFNEIKKNELIMEKEYDKLVNELEIIVELVLKCSNEITEENIGAEEKVYKFWGYNYVYNYIRINSDLFNNEYITKKPNHTGEFVNHYWKDRRQVSDLEKKLNIKMGEKKSLKAVKLYRITETYITPEDNKYRIQVRPEEVTSMIKLGEYDAIFGYLEEKNIYIEFNTIDIVNSKAKNRSLYVYKENIENFLAGKNDKEFMGNIIGIMTKKEFDSKYKIYDKGNEVVEENETKLGGLI